MRVSASAIRRLLLAGILAAGAACATTRDVQDAVRDSEAALIAQYDLREGDAILADTGPAGLPAPGGTSGGNEVGREQRVREKRDQAIGRIDAFLKRHEGNPDLDKTLHALRLRKAMLLAVSGERNLALATFSQVDMAKAGNARDVALIDSAGFLVWWWKVAGETVEPRAFKEEAERQRRVLDRVIREAPGDSGIRYYLVTLRAHLMLKWASTLGLRRPMLKEGLKAYALEFDEPARRAVALWVRGTPEASRAVGTDKLRWFGHVPITFDAYDRVYREELEELRNADPDDIDPALRSELEDGPVWPPECEWIVALRSP